MTITVRLFGPQARLAGQETVTLEMPEPEPTCAHVRASRAGQVPELQDSLAGSRFAVNFEYVTDERTPVKASDEVALIGMVSGG